MRIDNINVFSITDSNADATGATIQIEHGYTWSLVAVMAAGVTGTLKTQVSNDPADSKHPERVDTSSFVDLASVTLTASGVLNQQYAGYRWIRFIWTHTAGSSGTISAQFNCKGA